jgi:hypothetical protein
MGDPVTNASLVIFTVPIPNRFFILLGYRKYGTDSIFKVNFKVKF